MNAPAGFVHETVTYSGDESFLDGVRGFVREGLERDEVVVVVEPRPRLELLRDALGSDAPAVRLLDMTEVGANPGRIIGVWAAALDRAVREGRVLRGVGEPAHRARTPAELAECELHEVLLDEAFGGGPAWRLLCPYDAEGLPPAVCARAQRTHPYRSGPEGPEPTGGGLLTAADLMAAVLPPPADVVLRGEFREADLPAVRRTVATWARSCDLPPERVEALALAASELATNSVRHGGGGGTLAMWSEPGAAVVEFSDTGRLTDPLVGRRLPDPTQVGGRGVYLVHQLCDLVAVRSTPDGTTVRITTWR
ncbi:anti-sigma factor RsbA family regulatory protein [Geodermatophilus sp. SYSU D00703]